MRLIVSELACARGGRLLFEGLSFTVGTGEAAMLTGPNGAGKTSLLLILAGLLRAYSGEARLDDGGRGEAREDTSPAEEAHLVGHRDALKAQLTVAENLRFARLFLGAAASDVEAALDAVGLGGLAATPLSYLSAGQRKRVALARLLVASRPLWLLDEPTAALDAASRAMLVRLMEEHLALGGLIVAATHEPIGVAAAETPGRRMIGALAALIARDLKLATRIGGGFSLGLVFYLALVALMPFGVGPDLALLARIGPAVLWIGALLATLIGLDRLFQADEEDGSLDLMRLSGMPLEVVVAAKALAHWLATGLPLAVAAPLFGVMLGVGPAALLRTTLSLLPGTVALTFVGAIGAALTASLRRGGLLLSILVVPLAVPILIFGVAAAGGGEAGGTAFATPFLALCALALASIVGGSIGAAAALRVTR